MDFADPETAPTILPFTKFEIMEESEMLWARLLAHVTETVNQELLLRNEYLAEENRILRGQIKGRLLLSEGEKATLAEIGHRLGRKALPPRCPDWQSSFGTNQSSDFGCCKGTNGRTTWRNTGIAGIESVPP
jgi:hypothetical protein